MELLAKGRILTGNNLSLRAIGGNGSNGGGGINGGSGGIGGDGASGTDGAGSGGKGGNGGSGGAGGAGGGGGGGAGGTVKLVASVLNAASASVNTSGGAGGSGAPRGGDGRFLYSSNVAGGKPTSLTGTNNFNTGTDLGRNLEFNPWVFQTNGTNTGTPNIAGTLGGPTSADSPKSRPATSAMTRSFNVLRI